MKKHEKLKITRQQQQLKSAIGKRLSWIEIRWKLARERCNVDKKKFSPQVLSRSPDFEQEISRLLLSQSVFEKKILIIWKQEKAKQQQRSSIGEFHVFFSSREALKSGWFVRWIDYNRLEALKRFEIGQNCAPYGSEKKAVCVKNWIFPHRSRGTHQHSARKRAKRWRKKL